MKRSWKMAETALLVLGLLLIGVWVHVQAADWLFNRYHLRQWSPAAPDSPKKAPAASALDLGQVMGRIDIPDVGVQAVLLEGAEDEQLRLAVGHLPGTALPGQPGNAVFAGHRDTHFRGLRDIRIDQPILVTTADGTYEYRVASVAVVEPDDESAFESCEDQSSLTLITCFPFTYIGIAPQRFVVRARKAGLTRRD